MGEGSAFLKLSYGVYIVTSRLREKLNGCIANALMQVSDAPPSVAVCMSKKNLTHGYIQECGAFAVSVLKQSTPLKFIGLFGFRSGRDADKLSRVSFRTGATGCPLVTDNAVALFEVRVGKETDAGTHTVFMGKVVNGKVLGDEEPLTYTYYHDVLKGKTPENAPTYASRAGGRKPERREGEMKKYVCDVCGYVYDPEKGIPEDGIEPGTAFEDLPEDWVCPVCGAAKDQFSPTE